MRLSLLTCIRNTVQVNSLILREILLSIRRQNATLSSRQMSIEKLFPIGIFGRGESLRLWSLLTNICFCNIHAIACLAGACRFSSTRGWLWSSGNSNQHSQFFIVPLSVSIRFPRRDAEGPMAPVAGQASAPNNLFTSARPGAWVSQILSARPSSTERRVDTSMAQWHMIPLTN